MKKLSAQPIVGGGCCKAAPDKPDNQRMDYTMQEQSVVCHLTRQAPPCAFLVVKVLLLSDN